MFTGIVTDMGAVRAVDARGDTRFTITAPFDCDTVAIGASIACSGACLTVVDKGADWFAVDVSAETLSCTTLGAWRVGAKVNLERSLRVGEELGGHFVLGHVDGVATLTARDPVGGSERFEFIAPDDLARFIAVKGSVAIDGVSLTVNHVDGATFDINVIPHTLSCTILGAAVPGERVNLEIDVLARYVARLNQ